MKKIVTILMVMLLLCSVLYIPTTAASSKGVKEEYLNSDKWLTLSKNTTGPRFFVNPKGKPVELFGHHRYQEFASSEDIVYSATDGLDGLMKVYRDYGVNFIRLGIFAPTLCGGKKRTEAEIADYITKKIDPDVQAIIRNGMYVMLDIHMYPPEAECKTAKGTVQYARDYYLPILKGLARMYKDEPMVGAIEIWNEPYPADHDTLAFDKDVWNKEVRQYFIDAVNEIRKIDTRHVLLVSDYNAGWGMAIPETWGGYYDKVDPVYRNTCFSVHACHTELDVHFNTYKNYWKKLSKDNNICLLFGEIETIENISTVQGIQNLCDMFSETKDEYHFSGAFWGPHTKANGYFDIWADSEWVEAYCDTDPIKKLRYVTEAEDDFLNPSKAVEIIKNSTFFGSKSNGSGIALNKGLSATDYYETTWEIIQNIVYKAGKYKIMVCSAGKSGYAGDFILGYKDVDGVIHQIARFSGKNTNMKPYYQTVEFTASKQIASFVFFGCDAKQKSAIIDRIYVEFASKDKAVSTRAKVDIKDVNKIIDLNGKAITIAKPDTDGDKPTAPDDTTSELPDENKQTEDNKPAGDNNGGKVDVNPNGDENTIPQTNNKETTQNTTTTENDSEDMTLYLIIGGVILLAFAGFVVAVIIVTKKKNAEIKSEEN